MATTKGKNGSACYFKSNWEVNLPQMFSEFFWLTPNQNYREENVGCWSPRITFINHRQTLRWIVKQSAMVLMRSATFSLHLANDHVCLNEVGRNLSFIMDTLKTVQYLWWRCFCDVIVTTLKPGLKPNIVNGFVSKQADNAVSMSMSRSMSIKSADM